jgi:hypothetical protein
MFLFLQSNKEEVDRFHKHLDVCKQCRNNPMFPCVVGASLLMEAVVGKKKK